jgi:hypothetical protein
MLGITCANQASYDATCGDLSSPCLPRALMRVVIEPTFPFDQTVVAMNYVEQGRTKAGKVVSITPYE